MAEPWMKWAVAEGTTKTASRVLQKYAGIAAKSFAGSLLTLLVIGVIQMVGGFAGANTRGKRVAVERPQALAAVMFGVIASVMTVLGVFSFTYPGADVGITTFIVTMSIIPGALIDWIFFKHPLSARQWSGVAVFLAAGYAMLNFPELGALAALPAWVWLTCGIALLGAVNEGITQWQGRRKVNPLDSFVNNFWIGLTTVICAGAGLMFGGGWEVAKTLGRSFWIGSAAIGCIVIGMISFKLLAYQGGGSIALKKLIMQATYLITATILGWAFYAEPLTGGKFAGMVGYVVAFALMDRGTWQFVASRYLQLAPAR